MADAIVRLLKDPELRRRLGDAGLARARERFSAERMVYRRCASTAASRASRTMKMRSPNAEQQST